MEWKTNIIERLASDSQRLDELQININNLKSNIGLVEGQCKIKLTSQETNAISLQLQEIEENIMQLTSTHNKLSKALDEKDSNKNKRNIADGATKASEKISRLELELQKVQEMLAKIEVETLSEIRPKRSKLLVEYLCGCMRFKTHED